MRESDLLMYDTGPGWFARGRQLLRGEKPTAWSNYENEYGHKATMGLFTIEQTAEVRAWERGVLEVVPAPTPDPEGEPAI